MRSFFSFAVPAFVLAASLAHPVAHLQARAPLSPDPAGTKNIGNGQGGQFITGQCLGNADCQSGCCATLGSIGICSGPDVSFAQGKSGCGFGGGGSPAASTASPPATAAAPPAAASSSASGLHPDPAGAKNVGNGHGGQFITGQCLSNADCQSGCCATLGSIGICSGPDVSFAQGKMGCGFDSTGSVPTASSAPATSAAPANAAAPPAAASSASSGLHPDPAGAKNVGNGQGGQFITGQCLSNADCQSGCCATLGSIGICSGPDVSFAQGKMGCGFDSTGSAGASTAAPTASVAPANAAAAPAAASPAATSGLHPDPAGAKNVGNGQGGQFITGQCLSNVDCQSGCCATLGSIGICSGPDVSFAQGKSGCGFDSTGSSSAAAPAAPAASPAPANAAAPPAAASTPATGLHPDPAGAKNVGNGHGGQFITGQCLSNADCQSGCCATLGSIGICSGPDVSFAQGKMGCGFSSA